MLSPLYIYAPDHLLIHHVCRNGFQNYSLQHLPTDWGEADCSTVSQILLAFLEGNFDTFHFWPSFFFLLFHGILPFSRFLPILKNLYQATRPFEDNQEWAQISSATSILSGSCSRESLGTTTHPSFPVLFCGSASAHSDASLDKVSSPSSATKSLNLFHGCKASDKTGHLILMSMSCFQPPSSQTIMKYFPISQPQTLPAFPSLCL